MNKIHADTFFESFRTRSVSYYPDVTCPFCGEKGNCFIVEYKETLSFVERYVGCSQCEKRWLIVIERHTLEIVKFHEQTTC